MTPRVAAAMTELIEALAEAVRVEAATGPAAPDRLLSVAEACEALGGISRSALYEGPIARGDLRIIHVGRRTFVPASSIAAYIEAA